MFEDGSSQFSFSSPVLILPIIALQHIVVFSEVKTWQKDAAKTIRLRCTRVINHQVGSILGMHLVLATSAVAQELERRRAQ